jgi:hypothetical protein
MGERISGFAKKVLPERTEKKGADSRALDRSAEISASIARRGGVVAARRAFAARLVSAGRAAHVAAHFTLLAALLLLLPLLADLIALSLLPRVLLALPTLPLSLLALAAVALRVALAALARIGLVVAVGHVVSLRSLGIAALD